MTDEINIKDELVKIKESLNNIEVKPKKEKKFKLPSKAKVNKNKAKNNYVTVIKINDNGQFDFIREQIKEQTIVTDGVPRIASKNYIGYYKNNPIMILPSWSTEPIDLNQMYDESLKEGKNIAGMKLLLNRIEQGEIKPKTKISGKIVFAIIVVIIIAGYLIFTGG